MAMIGMGSVVVSGIPSFAKAYGNPARIHGANIVGMQRNGFSEEQVKLAEKSFAEHVDTTLINELETYLK
jgi:UDP-N-acetylglucosamine acyltransferase